MAITVNLDVMLAIRKMKSNELAEQIGITPQNLSVLRSGRAKAIRFSTLSAICQVLDCQPGDILAYTETEQDKDQEGTDEL
ncbi:helix-turn-helix domain-containing protein [Alkalimonas amylolytica]|uniref:Putative transcriptional regulator n=1 Tax=Alkalimonas amylolytica TaxID=152573 RepID=A0A1H4D668_ALKAM|nr:helix-turn-helix transcriptional regulator [Alkalimonas amylolytica]SEA68313.1 putative transcriptional regulator [Alkalimonas amylolytica]